MPNTRPLEAEWAALLAKYRGGVAEIWEYGVSLGRLNIRVTHPQLPGGLRVNCSPCEYICAPTGWGPIDIIVELDDDDGYIIRDKQAGVEIRGLGVGVVELERR